MTPREAYKRGYDAIEWKPIVHEERTYTPPARSSLPCPMVMGDNLEREAWGPDGKCHTSKASLRASYKPSGNPMGKSYIEIGNEKIPDPPSHRHASDASIDQSIRNALAKAGAS